ncbi:MAG: RNA polymerase sigma factor [Kofleriaceae bacterium]
MAGSSLHDLSVEDLAARAQRGDQASFEELVTRLRMPLTRFLGRQLDRASDADDAVQETFLRAYRSLDRYDPDRRFETWLFAIGKNVAATHRDAGRRRTEREHRGAPIDTIAAPVPATAAALWQTAEQILGPESYRAMWLRYAQELSIREVASELGRSVVATKVMLFRARRKLLEEDIR